MNSTELDKVIKAFEDLYNKKYTVYQRDTIKEYLSAYGLRYLRTLYKEIRDTYPSTASALPMVAEFRAAHTAVNEQLKAKLMENTATTLLEAPRNEEVMDLAGKLLERIRMGFKGELELHTDEGIKEILQRADSMKVEPATKPEIDDLF